ncbi:hypothetical protein EHQ53_12215 [Leptospira langatensis]|uniref:Lipocalin-like domain-containing protein n=1 Tax=Leptospira langatensis TaxID=2484983 RepID=A0A5F1ZSX0_9LEPT|nr:hypothetical protein EHO57_14290 [Leptospira langatensis]TGL40740.1 hypothetical protein EHQ53_12215 [Leptospira langatensis]
MRNITLFLLLSVGMLFVTGCKEQKETSEETQTLLNGNWVAVYNCVQDPTPNPTAWLIIQNNNIISCMNNTNVKGTIISSKIQGDYRFSWSSGAPSNAQYPVGGPLQLLGVTTQANTICYTRARSASDAPASYCNKL